MYAEKHLQTTLDICAILIQRDFCQCPFSISLLAVRFSNMSAILPLPLPTMRMYGVLYNDTIAPLNLIGIIQPLVSLKNRKRWWLLGIIKCQSQIAFFPYKMMMEGGDIQWPAITDQLSGFPSHNQTRPISRGGCRALCRVEVITIKPPQKKEKEKKKFLFLFVFTRRYTVVVKSLRDNIRQ